MTSVKSPLLCASMTAVLVLASGLSTPASAALPVSQIPLSIGSGQNAPPLNMLVMGRDHKLYYEAYNDASDLNGDGVLDVGYKGHLSADDGGIDYFGYFDSYRCYTYGSQKFTPGAAAPNKTCSNAWSGDFLNYLTTSRMDALRKVLYGGHRVVDTATATTLERAYIPQDAHSWGKEYTSIAVDGYDIRDYAPLSLPKENTRHLFANTTLRNDESKGPLLRVLNDSKFRIWEWVAKENPVAGSSCGSGSNCETTGGTQSHPGHPNNRGEFNSIESEFAIPANQYGGVFALDSLNCTSGCNLGGGAQDNFLTIATTRFQMRNRDAANGDYQFCVDGDDAVDVQILSSNGATVLGSAGWYGGHGFANNCDSPRATANIRLDRNTTYQIKFRHEEMTGGEGYRLRWRKVSGANQFSWTEFSRKSSGNDNKNNGSGGDNTDFQVRFYNLRPSQNSSRITDYRVRVDVCVAGALDPNCKQYPNGNYKPTGILHDYGEDDRMMFGLLTGSYAKNTQGGVVRKNISSFADEVNANDGTFASVVGMVKTIDRLKTIEYNAYQYTCGWIANRAINDGECSMWGNPVGEMMWESLRYFAGAGSPRTEFNIASNAKDASVLSLPRPEWVEPYTSVEDGGSGFLRCATPVMTVISDINPSYDGSVPGSKFVSISGAGDPEPVNSLNVSNEVDAIWVAEGGGTRQVFIGESGGVADSNPTVKAVSNLSTVRGLAPEEPSKQGTYYSAGVARFGATNRIGGDKNAMTYAVALASPLPTLTFPIGDSVITVVPFAKSPYGRYGGDVNPDGSFQPTNQIVDIFVEKIANTDPAGADQDDEVNEGRPYAEFRINYEDVEQGADHDMDAIVRYTFQVTADDELDIALRSEYASGSIVQYIGYIISGTTKDGIYLEVSDCDTSSAYPDNDFCPSASHGGVRYSLNTPPGEDAGYCTNPTNLASSKCFSLPYETSRRFVPGTSSGAELLKDPLWYAAKYGRPPSYTWDEDGDQSPDNYFLVTNAGTLKEQLDKAFSQIIADTQDSGGVAASGARATEGFMAYVPEYTTTDWTGDLRAHKLNPGTGALLPAVWSAKTLLASIADTAVTSQSGRKVYYIDPSEPTASTRLKDFTVAALGGGDPDAAAAKLGISNLAAIYPGKTIEDVVNYLRGDHRNELKNGGVFRDRSGRIGDIFSQPAVLDQASYGYLNLPVAAGGGYGTGGYAKFVESKKDRVPVVFVASNDGFLHAFNASDSATTGGRELFAIAPSSVLGNMAQLASPSYTHRFYVDGSPSQGDAYIGGSWKTVLLGSTGAGGRSVFALDVTDPVTQGAKVLWEFSHADLGLTIGTPKIARLPNGQWAAVFGNGYNSDNNQAFLFIVNLETGALIAKVATNTEGTASVPNGMATPAVIDLQGDGTTDLVYAGDYYGNLWRIPLSASGTTLNTPVASTLFTATDSAAGGGAAARQPITGGVTASVHPVNGQLVFFGTGSYFLEGDNAAPSESDQVQSFYAIWDDNGDMVTRSSLVEQTFTASGSGRTASDNVVDWGSDKGWFIDLKTGASPADGERFIGQPTVALGRVFFTTFVSQGDECEPGGTNWINALWTTSGSGALSAGLESSTSLTGSGGPIRDAITIVTGRTGGDEGSEDCDPSADPNCVPPAPVDVDGDGVIDDLGAVPPRACILSVDLLTAVGFNPLLRMACGRQSWRHIQ
ncbi:PilC/PilY family type IV pilus protein [Denitratimonas sp. CY0512]|uniref:pilus assembly protein n=1 Tax=Denitratimonas sp. CY0512 TaxID=3131940 RepID=UPI0030AF4368